MPSLGVIALLLVLLPTGVWFWRAWRVNIPRNPRVFLVLWTLGLIIGVLALMQTSAPVAGGWAVGVAVVLLYLMNTGAQAGAADQIRVGETLRAFTATSSDNEPFDSASLAGGWYLLKFFRGHW